MGGSTSGIIVSNLSYKYIQYALWKYELIYEYEEIENMIQNS